MKNSYVLVTPARNEEAYIVKTIQSVVAQTILPRKWVVVSDGSTDHTDEIVKRCTAKHNFIELLRVEPGSGRDFESKVFAIRAGLERFERFRYDFIGNLDADVSFEPDYFERILEKFENNTKLGIGGGTIHELQNGKYRARSGNRVRSVPGALQLFRRACFEQIGGFPPLKHGGEDTVMEIKARMGGWEVRSFFDIIARHHKPAGAKGLKILSGAFLGGSRDYLLGNHPMYEISKCARRLTEKPWLIGSLLRLGGYGSFMLRRERRQIPDEVVQFLRREQIERLSCLLRRK